MVQIPDSITSISLAKKGQSSAAISNALGSQVRAISR